MPILVTGASGFIGDAHLAAEIASQRDAGKVGVPDAVERLAFSRGALTSRAP